MELYKHPMKTLALLVGYLFALPLSRSSQNISESPKFENTDYHDDIFNGLPEIVFTNDFLASFEEFPFNQTFDNKKDNVLYDESANLSAFNDPLGLFDDQVEMQSISPNRILENSHLQPRQEITRHNKSPRSEFIEESSKPKRGIVEAKSKVVKKSNKRGPKTKPCQHEVFYLLSSKKLHKSLKKSLELVNGCFKNVYSVGSTFSHLLIVLHEDSITVISPFFITTLPSKIDRSSQSPLIKSCRDCMRPVKRAKNMRNFMVENSQNYGLYARIDKNNKLVLKNPPKNETIFVKRGAILTNLKDYSSWDLQFGDQFIWIATADAKALQQKNKDLQNAIKHKGQKLYDALKTLFAVKVAVITYGKVNKECHSNESKIPNPTITKRSKSRSNNPKIKTLGIFSSDKNTPEKDVDKIISKNEKASEIHRAGPKSIQLDPQLWSERFICLRKLEQQGILEILNFNHTSPLMVDYL